MEFLLPGTIYIENVLYIYNVCMHAHMYDLHMNDKCACMSNFIQLQVLPRWFMPELLHCNEGSTAGGGNGALGSGCGLCLDGQRAGRLFGTRAAGGQAVRQILGCTQASLQPEMLPPTIGHAWASQVTK